MESLAKGLYDLSFSLLFDDRPTMRNDIRKSALAFQTLLAHSPAIESITIECKVRDSPEPRH
jgi:hypothetical protein